MESNRYSMQMQMMDIICSYLHGGLAQASHEFLKVFDGDVNDLTMDGLKHLAMKTFQKPASPSIEEKHEILDFLNRCKAPRSIHSMPLESLTSKGSDKPVNRVS